jgi:Sec-independent protein translocase protein TatA
MFGHPLELIIVLVLALIFFGPEKLPEVAATAGKFVRDLRASFDAAMNTDEETLPDDFSTYYYESMARSGEEPVVEEMPDPADEGADFSHTGEMNAVEAVHAEPSEIWRDPWSSEESPDPADDVSEIAPPERASHTEA